MKKTLVELKDLFLKDELHGKFDVSIEDYHAVGSPAISKSKCLSCIKPNA